jgi:hypothetical protein
MVSRWLNWLSWSRWSAWCFFFSLPRLQNNPFLDDSKKSARWLIGKVQALKESAIRDQKQYSLHFDLDSGRIWETNESMSQEDYESAALNSYALPDDVRIIDVEYPAKEKISFGQTEITFYKAGYTDKAFVHMQEGETYLSFLIEPFLSNVQVIEEYAGFEDWGSKLFSRLRSEKMAPAGRQARW